MKRISIIIFVTLLMLLQSCIKDDTSDCKSGLLLRFRYTLNDQYSNLFDSEVDRITLFVFDSQNKYVDSFSEQGDKLTNSYIMNLPLPVGKYNIVVYGGDFTTYSVGEINNQDHTVNYALRKGVTDIADFRQELKSISGTENQLYPASTPDDLYAGLAVNAVSALNNQKVTDVELIKDTKKIKVKITNQDPVLMPFDVYITAPNGRYKFDNNIDPNYGIFKYTPISSSVQPGNTEVDLKIMRLMLWQSPMLVIKNSATSEVIFNENMIEQILSTQKYVSQEDFDREDEFIFEINIQSKDNNIVASVSINGWKINNITPEI